MHLKSTKSLYLETKKGGRNFDSTRIAPSGRFVGKDCLVAVGYSDIGEVMPLCSRSGHFTASLVIGWSACRRTCQLLQPWSSKYPSCLSVARLYYCPVHSLIWVSLLCCCTVLSQFSYCDISLLHCVLFSMRTHTFTSF